MSYLEKNHREKVMKRFLLLLGISIGVLSVGAVAFSITKALKWSRYFGMTCFEFSYQLNIAIKLLQLGRSLEMIKLQTGIDFSYEELAKYFLNKRDSKGESPHFHIYKEDAKT
jgi:hypothetical protein